jgi:phage major head subunit gpT-like protein
MAMKEISKYVVYHKVGSTTAITVYYVSGETSEIKPLSTDEATYLVDLLRNVKPLYYDDATGMIQTNYEDAGKGVRR